jgi:hypothetical protein
MLKREVMFLAVVLGLILFSFVMSGDTRRRARLPTAGLPAAATSCVAVQPPSDSGLARDCVVSDIVIDQISVQRLKRLM